MFRGGPISRCAEFERIRALPTRDSARVDLDTLSAALRRPGSDATLRPVQAQALADLVAGRGLVGGIGVGQGKTLIGFLAARAVGAAYPLILVPGSLVGKTQEDLERYGENWIFPVPEILSYEKLARDRDEILARIRPDLIVADECHRMRNPVSAAARKVVRYLSCNPCRFAAMSGTLMARSIREWAHLSAWALGPGSPLPIVPDTVGRWADALDPCPAALTVPDGEPLLDLAVGPTDTSDPRQAIRTRLVATPGVILTGDAGVGASIQITAHQPPLARLGLLDAQRLAHSAWEYPDGTEIVDAVEQWRLVRSLAWGWFSRLIAPDAWRAARKRWGYHVHRFVLGYHAADSPGALVDLVRDGGPAWAHLRPDLDAWEYARQRYAGEVRTEVEWVDPDRPVQILDALDLDPSDTRPPLVWVESVALGTRLSEALGIPYFRAHGTAGDGARIHTLDVAIPCLASVGACGTGLNLQAWSRNLVLEPSGSADVWEQLIGRTHRAGQRADTVTVDVVLASDPDRRQIDRAREAAAAVEKTTGTPQRLAFADWI